MKENNELEKDDLCVDADMDVDCDTGTITAYIESWFDIDRKFGTHILESDNMWLNLYADYSPSNDSLKMFYQVETDDNSEFFDYEPTDNEAQLIKDMIAEKIMQIHGQTPQEFCEEFYGTQRTVYVYKNRGSLSAKKMLEKRNRLTAYCEENGYQPEGSISISAPMNRCGAEFQYMIDYCKSRGISKILVDSLHDIGRTSAEVNKVVGILYNQGIEVEIADSGQIFTADNEENLSEQDEEQTFTMGGM